MMSEKIGQWTKRTRVLSVIACICAMVMALTLFGCGGEKKAETAQAGSEQGVPAAGQKFVVGFDPNFPPFGYMDDKGGYTGFDLELAQAVCKKLGWEYVAQPINWDAKNAELDSGTINCIWNGFSSTAREGKYEMTGPYMKNSQIFLVKKSSGINSFADLAGKEIQVQTDSAALDLFATKYKDLSSTFTVTQVADYTTAFLNLDAGACDAVAMDSTVASYLINGRDDFKFLDEKLTEEDYVIAFKLGNTQLKDTVEKTVAELYKDGTVTELTKKYFGDVEWLMK